MYLKSCFQYVKVLHKNLKQNISSELRKTSYKHGQSKQALAQIDITE